MHLPDATESDLPKLQETFQKIAESRGYVSNLMQSLALVPDGLHAFAALGDYCRFGTLLTERQREIVILVALRDVYYGWVHHAPIGRLLGITEEQLRLIHDGRTPRDLEPADRALCEYAHEVVACRRIPPRVNETLRASFEPRQVVDAALLASHYMGVAALIIALEVELESPEAVQAAIDWNVERLSSRQPEQEAPSASDDAAASLDESG